jgi:hypothetical protein
MACSFLILAALLAGSAAAVTVTSGTDQFGRNCDIVTWTDSTGNPRAVWIVNQTPGSFISKMTYFVNGGPVTATVPSTSFAFCTLVNHFYSSSTSYNDDEGGNYTSNNGTSDPASAQPGGSTYVEGAGVTRTLAFSGAHHLVWQGSFQMYSHPWESAEEWYITVQYLFIDGRDDFNFSNAYDSGAIPQADLGSTNIAPYCDFSYDGVGNPETDPQSGIGFGTIYQFASDYASGKTLNASTGYTYNAANTIPYAWMYKDASLTNREMGAVQNQPYSEKDAGYNSYWDMPVPPSTGVTMPGNIPFQLNEFAGYVGMRFTWGTQYTSFQNNHTDGLSIYPAGGPTGSWGVYPVNAGSFNILIDPYTNQGVSQLIVDTQNIYQSTLTATLGSVVTTGPKGPGNYVSSQTSTMPTLTYTHPGFDFVYRSWRFNTDPTTGNAILALNAGGTLNRPSFILNQFPATVPCRVLLNGALQVVGTDYEVSYDSGAQQLYLTFLKALPTGSQTLEVDSYCPPTATSTPCKTCPTNTPSWTPSPTSTVTATETPTQTKVPSAVKQGPIPWPNPVSKAGPVSVTIYLPEFADSPSLELFTSSFRKILDQPLGPLEKGVHVVGLQLVDAAGGQLANGLYYLVLVVPTSNNTQREIGKLLILK